MNNQLTIFDRQFQKLHARSWEIIEKTPNEKLFWQPNKIDVSFPVNSCGEYILRSAGTVEQTFNGITAKLWDDPFEWTLPEQLSSGDLILEYLSEVEETRRKGFALFASDEDLRRELPAPEKLKTIFALLLETIARAEHFQGRAFAVFSQTSAAMLDVKENFSGVICCAAVAIVFLFVIGQNYFIRFLKPQIFADTRRYFFDKTISRF
jgi:hypothetical protein